MSGEGDRMYICTEGAYYRDNSWFKFVTSLKKTAVAICKRDGYKHNKKQDLWLNDNASLWRRIDRIEVVK